jgi:hypothetical protein
MNLAKVSIDRLHDTFSHWKVDEHYFDPMYNYLVYGLDTGRFLRSVLANDCMSVFNTIHPNLTIQSLKRLCNWIANCLPTQAYGSYHNVDQWINLSEEKRRELLEIYALIYDTKQEIWKILST